MYSDYYAPDGWNEWEGPDAADWCALNQREDVDWQDEDDPNEDADLPF